MIWRGEPVHRFIVSIGERADRAVKRDRVTEGLVLGLRGLRGIVARSTLIDGTLLSRRIFRRTGIRLRL